MNPYPTRPGPEDQTWFRRVLGQFPTGVTLVTAQVAGEPSGLLIGSFASVSLDPPMIAFYPGKGSTTWPRIREAGSFCVNVLAADQEDVCRAMLSKDAGRFGRFSWAPSTATGSPALAEAVAWIDCRIESVADAGDHWMVLGRVVDLDMGDRMPLLFFRGGFGRFETGARIATEIDLGPLLHALNRVRTGLERLADRHDCECVAVAHVNDEIVLLASAGSSSVAGLPSRVGERAPAMAPFGRSIMAWESDRVVDRWLSAVRDPGIREEYRAMLGLVRRRGYSVSLDRDPDLAPGDTPPGDLRTVLDSGVECLDPETVASSPVSVAVPVLGPEGYPLLALAAYALPPGVDVPGVAQDLEQLAHGESAPRRMSDAAR